MLPARLDVSRVWAWATAALTLGGFAVAIALAPPASAAPVRGLAWLLFVGSSVHVAATGWLYTLPEVRDYARQHRERLVRMPIAMIGVSGLAAAAASPSALAWCLLPYYAWQFFHFQKQNLGLAALAASSRRIASLRPVERRGVIAHPGLLQLRISPVLSGLYPAAAALFAGAAATGIIALARRPAGDSAFGFWIIYLTSLGFWLPVFVFRSPYAAIGGMTIAHGLQYLLLVGLVAAGPPAGRMLRLAVLCNLALAGGAALNAASHLHGPAPAGRFLFGAYLGAVMAHFVIDAGLWRLRDPFPRAFLAARVPSLVPARRHQAYLRPPIDRQPM